MIKVEDELNAAERGDFLSLYLLGLFNYCSTISFSYLWIALEAAGENASEMDELEAYMEAIKNGKFVFNFFAFIINHIDSLCINLAFSLSVRKA